MVTRRVGRNLASLAVIGCMAVLSACGSSSSTSSAPGPSATGGPGVDRSKQILDQYLKEPTSITQDVPLSKTPPTGKSIIYLSQKNVATTTTIGGAMEEGAKAIGWKYHDIAYDPSNPADLQQAFSSALLQHPTAVAVTGIDPNDYASSVKQYAAAGVPLIVSAGTRTTPVPKIVAGWPLLDRSNEAEALAAWFTVDSNGSGNALLVHVNGFPILDRLVDEFKADTTKFCPGCKVNVLALPITQVLQGQSNSAVVAALRKQPDTKYLLFDNGDFSAGINSALAAAGVQDMKIGGLNMQPEQAAALQNKTQNAWTGENSKIAGYQTIDIAARYVLGDPINNKDESENIQLLTPDNIGSDTTFNKPRDALTQFEKLWHVGS